MCPLIPPGFMDGVRYFYIKDTADKAYVVPLLIPKEQPDNQYSNEYLRFMMFADLPRYNLTVVQNTWYLLVEDTTYWAGQTRSVVNMHINDSVITQLGNTT